jgi:hypothetical protein
VLHQGEAFTPAWDLWTRRFAHSSIEIHRMMDR